MSLDSEGVEVALWTGSAEEQRAFPENPRQEGWDKRKVAQKQLPLVADFASRVLNDITASSTNPLARRERVQHQLES